MRPPLVGDGGLERFNQLRPSRAQLLAMRQRKLREQVFAAGGQPEEHFAAVRPAAHTPHPSIARKPVGQFDGAVMANLQLPGQESHRGLEGVAKPLDGQKRLVLLRIDSYGSGGALAELEVTPDFVPEIRESAIVHRSQR